MFQRSVFCSAQPGSGRSDIDSSRGSKISKPGRGWNSPNGGPSYLQIHRSHTLQWCVFFSLPILCIRVLGYLGLPTRTLGLWSYRRVPSMHGMLPHTSDTRISDGNGIGGAWHFPKSRLASSSFGCSKWFRYSGSSTKQPTPCWIFPMNLGESCHWNPFISWYIMI